MSAGCRRQCKCGRTFYHHDRDDYDWDPGEFEGLEADPNATSLDYTVETLTIAGTEYCMDCDCWHGQARMIKGWLDHHARHVAQYLTLEKQRKQAEADASPVVADALIAEQRKEGK